MEKYNRWHCRQKHEAPQFTLKTGTIMEDSPLGIDKWLTAMWQIVNCKNGISSYEVHREVDPIVWTKNRRSLDGAAG